MRIDEITRSVKVDRKEVEGLWRNAELRVWGMGMVQPRIWNEGPIPAAGGKLEEDRQDQVKKAFQRGGIISRILFVCS